MPRYIDADALEDSLGVEDEDIIFKEILRDAPTVSVEPVVHCKECRWGRSCSCDLLTCDLDERDHKSYDFCSYGERKE